MIVLYKFFPEYEKRHKYLGTLRIEQGKKNVHLICD